MKVLNYLEYNNSSSEIREEHYRFLLINFNGNHKKGSINSIYSQPFTSELIMEYFKNWEYDGVFKEHIPGVPTLYYDNWHTEEVYDYISIYQDENKIKYGRVAFLVPETLDDFIRDCQRTGIKLEWKDF